MLQDLVVEINNNELPMKMEKEISPKIVHSISSKSLIAALIGGVIFFLIFSGSLEKALNFGSQIQSSLAPGIGVVSAIGTVIWNLFISMFGALFFGVTTAISLLFYNWLVKATIQK